MRKATFMETLHTRSIHTFRVINPERIYAEFYFSDLATYESINLGYCQKNEIVRIDDHFFRYAGAKEDLTSKPLPSVIQFRKGKKLLKEIGT